MLKITLFCAAGISTAMLVRNMEQAASDQGIEVEIRSEPISALEDVTAETTDVALLGPQVSYEAEHAHQVLDPKDVPVAVIPMTDYGLVKGDKILAFAQELARGEE